VGTEVDLAAVSCPHISPNCPTIHTYSHTRQVRKIMCVIPTLSAARDGDCRWPDSTSSGRSPVAASGYRSCPDRRLVQYCQGRGIPDLTRRDPTRRRMAVHQQRPYFAQRKLTHPHPWPQARQWQSNPAPHHRDPAGRRAGLAPTLRWAWAREAPQQPPA
jgi:hypothetical protein